MERWEVDIKLDQIETDLLDVYIKIREAEWIIGGPIGLLSEHDILLGRLKVMREVMNG